MTKKALVLGASGLVGRQLVRQLLEHPDFQKVTVLVRRPYELRHPRLESRVVHFSHPEDWGPLVRGDIVFSCLGTTNKQVRGNRDQYWAIDHDIPFETARQGLKNGVKRFVVITALGASTHSRIFYSRMKGRLEQDLSALPFESLHILRPSFLAGVRENPRTPEGLGIWLFRILAPVLRGPLRKYRSIQAGTLARAMIRYGLQESGGIQIHESDALEREGSQPNPP